MISDAKLKNFKFVIKLAGHIADNMIKDGSYISGMQLAVRQDVDTSLRIFMFNKVFETSRRLCGCLVGSCFAVAEEPEPLRKSTCRV
jgi:hypothetical protein